MRWLKILALLGLFYHLLLVVRPDERLISRPLLEDAFYSLSVSRSIGNGTGFTVDGINPTNGVQPLVCLLYAPIFTLSGDNTSFALRLVLLLQVLFYAAASFSVAAWWRMLRTDENAEGSARDFDDGGVQGSEVEFWLLSALLVWNYSLVSWIINGLETGLALALAFSAATFYQRHLVGEQQNRIRSAVALGCILGVGVLARIDIAFLVPAILLWHLTKAHLGARDLKGSDRRRALVATLSESFAIGSVALLVSTPWWIFNVLTFGSLLPISGQAQQMLNPDRVANLTMSAAVLSDSFLLNLHLPMTMHAEYWFAGALAFALLLLLLFSLPRTRQGLLDTWREWSSGRDFSRAVPMALLATALTIYYSFFFGAPHFQSRYLVSIRLLIFGAMITILVVFYQRSGSASPRRLALHLLLASYLLSSGFLLLRSFMMPAKQGNLYTVPTEWIRENVEPGETVGMFQSGTTGFLLPNVENLDGKVNARALAATRRGDLAAYVDSASFDYVIDWDVFTRQLFADRALRARYAPVDTLAYGFVVWRRGL